MRFKTLGLACVFGGALFSAAPAQDIVRQGATVPFLDVGSHSPITILINSSPWFPGFEAVTELYEAQTGNKVKLDVAPFAGMLEKSRNAVRAGESPLDLINLDTQQTVEFYSGGFVTPLKEIDPSFELPEDALSFGDSACWHEAKQFRVCEGGQLMAFHPNGNIQNFYYRTDLLDKPPQTWDEVIANCRRLQKPRRLYGFVPRTQRGNSIRFNFMPYMLGHGGSIVRDAENGDFTVTFNSPQVLAALNLFIQLTEECGPPNKGNIGQSDMIQLMQAGRALQSIIVIAGFANMDDPNKSIVVGNVNVAVIPRPKNGQHATTIGNWHLAVPANLPDARKRAAVAFAKWFLTFDAQYAYAKAGAIPVIASVFESDLIEQDRFRWMPAYLESQRYAHQVLGYKEGAQVEEVLGLRLNQAVIGELTPAEALNTAAREIMEIFKHSGRQKTGMLPALPPE